MYIKIVNDSVFLIDCYL